MEIVGPGAKYKRPDGYITVYYPSHPDAMGSWWMLEHRLVAEKMLGRRLKKREHVHHKNGVKDDNREENLQVILIGDHARISAKTGKERRRAIREELAEYRKRFGPLTPENQT